MISRYYFVPGFDPVGPSRYLSKIKNACKQLAVEQGQQLNISPFSAPASLPFSGFRMALTSRPENAVELLCFDNTNLIREHWSLSPSEIVKQSSFILFRFAVSWIARLWRRDRRLVVMIGLQLLSVQGAWILPLLAVALFSSLLVPVGPWILAASLSLVVVLAACCWWWMLGRFHLLWLIRALLYQIRLAQRDDQTPLETSQRLADALSELEASHPAEAVVLTSHSSGVSLLVLTASQVRSAGSNVFVRRLQLLTLGRSFPLFSEPNQLLLALAELLRKESVPWTDLTSEHDYLCDHFIHPSQYLNWRAESGSYPTSVAVSYGFPEADLHSPLGVIRTLLRQYEVHSQYLTGVPGCADLSLPRHMFNTLMQP